MIAKEFEPENDRRRSFEASINYILGRGAEPLPGKVLKTWHHGVVDVETAWKEMEARASRNRRAREVVSHLLISYAVGEEPTEEQQLADIEGLLEALGMKGHQYVAASHCDTDNLHLHIVANRIGPDNLCANVIGDYRIHQIFCAKVALQRGWNIVPGRFNGKLVKLQRDYQEPQWPITKGEFRREQKTGEPPWQDLVRDRILAARDQARGWNEFRKLLALHGIVLKHTVKKGDFHGLSFALGYENDAPGCAASRIDPECRFKALELRFGPWVEPQEKIELAIASPVEIEVAQRPETFPNLYWLIDNLDLRHRYGLYRDEHKSKNTMSRTALSSAWAVEKELRQQTTARRRTNHKAHRQAACEHFKRGPARDMALHAIDFMVRWNQKSDMDMAKRRWAQKKLELSDTHPMPQPLTFRQFAEGLAEKDDGAAVRYLEWLSVQRNRKRPKFAAQVSEQANAHQAYPRPSEAVPHAVAVPVAAEAPATNEQEKQKEEKMAEAAVRRREEAIEQLARCKKIYDDEKQPVIARLRAACAAHIGRMDLDNLNLTLDSEDSDKVGDLLAEEICRGADTGLYKKLFDGWADKEWAKPLADKIRSTMIPSRDAPELVVCAKAEWSRSLDKTLRPADRAFAIAERAATASARGEPERAIRKHYDRMMKAAGALDSQSRSQFDLKLASVHFQNDESETEPLARRSKSLKAIAKEMRNELRSPTYATVQDGAYLHTGSDQNRRLP